MWDKNNIEKSNLMEYDEVFYKLVDKILILDLKEK